MFYSRKTTEAEAKLHSFQLETLALVYTVERFKVYLHGIKFTAITDCSALEKTLEKKDTNAKIARWAMVLGGYDFEISHRKGEKMQHVDALSRVNVYAVEEEDDEYDAFHNNIYVNQLRDEKIKNLGKDIREGKNKDYQLREGIIYKKEGSKLLLVIPELMENSVVFKFHNEFGHFGADKTLELIKRSFYFKNMRQKIIEHIKECIECIRFNPKNKRFDGNLHIITKGKIPFKTIHIDHVGPLEKTELKNLHILGVVDGFTKFIKFYATKTTNTSEVIKALGLYFENYSMPERIVSDRGACFTSKAFKEFMLENNICHILNATASPQANGQIERYNRTLIPVLSKLSSEKKQQWDKVLKEAEFLINNSWNRGINDVPARLLFGVEQKMKIEENLVRFMELVNGETDIDLEARREKAAQIIDKGQQYNKQQHDKHCKKNTSYHKDDLVMIRNVKVVGEAGKLQPKFKGPYRIKEVLNQNRYVVEDIPGFQITNVHFEGIFDPLNMRLYQRNKNGIELNESSEED